MASRSCCLSFQKSWISPLRGTCLMNQISCRSIGSYQGSRDVTGKVFSREKKDRSALGSTFRQRRTSSMSTYMGTQASSIYIRTLSTSSHPPTVQPALPGPLPLYKPPTTGLLSLLPLSWLPYAELARLDKPAGTYYLFFPCLFSTLFAASYTHAAPAAVLGTVTLFATGALIMRGAGCTINDLWDRNLDPQVERTRLRPLARGAVSPQAALVFAGAQCLAGLGVLLQFPPACLAWGIPSLLLVGTYPLAKRVTHYPQVVLGLTFSWGALMGFPALGVDLLSDTAAAAAAGCLYASCVSWTVLYDMIYAHMDLKDDRKAGIKSIALKHEQETKQVLAGLALIQVGLLAGAGAFAGAGPVFFAASCGSALGTLSWMIWRVNLKSVQNCWWWFKYGAWFTGGGISFGLLGEYLVACTGEPGDAGNKERSGPMKP